ncbi:hypothetical protein BOC55_35275 [Burkholderia pseudomallei]|nr:hypothetical protein BOC47_24190 [Burkholderia pseudomallei]ARL84194.1 hypothetical protein BOC55_35275 [Burkholderia pseudomallei]
MRAFLFFQPIRRETLMSYSFGFTAHTKDDAKARVVSEFEEVVRVQPVHAKDQSAAVAAAHAFIDGLHDDDACDINVSISGSLSWVAPEAITGMNLSVGVYYVPRAADESTPAAQG